MTVKTRSLRLAGGLIAASLIALAAASSASAAVLVDASPVGGNNGNWSNVDVGQNFLVSFTLNSAATINEFDIYTYNFFATLGNDVTVRVRSDNGGAPASADLFKFTSTLTNVSGMGTGTLAGTSFAPISLAAGTYWFGVSGAGYELGWSSFTGNTPNSILLGGDNVIGQVGLPMAFRVVGEAGNGAVPEPASWAMMLGGFGLVGAAMRRRQRAAVSFA